MTSAAARIGTLDRVRAGSLAVALGIVALAVIMGLSLLLRTRALLAGFWIDEGLSVGIASHPLTDIPSVLRLDGSPPLYYMLLHVWMSIFGNGEGETHGMSVGFALLTIPAGLWAGRTLGGARAGWMAAIIAALHPFLTYYAQETRMYALAALLSLLATTCFIRAYALRERRFIAPFAVTAALLAFTHNWGLFILAGTGVAFLLALWRAGDRRVLLRDGLLGYGGLLVLYAVWIPTLLFQSAHTGAPWATAPDLEKLLSAVFTTLGGSRGGPIILLVGGAGIVALMGQRIRVPGADLAPLQGPEGDRRRRAAESLLIVIVVGLVVAWLASQIAPAFTTRYFAVLVGPSIVLAGIGLAHARGLGIAALVVLAVIIWSPDRSGELHAKSNVRSVADRVLLRPVGPGDLVLSTHPEQVPVLHYYLGDGFRYADPMGFVADPTVMDWRDVLDRLQAARPTPTADKIIDRLEPGQALILVQPILRAYYAWRAPWTKLVKRRALQWEGVLQRDPRLRRVEALPRFGLSQPPRGVRVVLYRRR